MKRKDFDENIMMLKTIFFEISCRQKNMREKNLSFWVPFVLKEEILGTYIFDKEKF